MTGGVVCGDFVGTGSVGLIVRTGRVGLLVGVAVGLFVGGGVPFLRYGSFEAH